MIHSLKSIIFNNDSTERLTVVTVAVCFKINIMCVLM